MEPCDLCSTVLSTALSQTKPAVHYIPHQPNYAALKTSADNGCNVCAAFKRGLLRMFANDDLRPQHRWNPTEHSDFGFEVEAFYKAADAEITPGLAICYRLKFNIVNEDDPDIRLWFPPQFQIRTVGGHHTAIPRQKVTSLPDLAVASKWVEQCSHYHGRCPGLEDTPLPTRLVDVGSAVEEPRLVEPLGKRGRYAALSHCWGKGGNPLKTEQHNFGKRLASIPYDELPKTFQDAVSVVRDLDLGLRYLWIDSLCIIQGDQDDFEKECSKMYSVFANATLVLCCPVSQGPDDGLLHERRSTDIYKEHEIEVDVTVSGRAIRLSIVEEKREGWNKNQKDADHALEWRAWILQERLLSSRMLYFGRNQMYMECASADFFENLTCPLKVIGYPQSKDPLFEVNAVPIWTQWARILAEYTTCDLTEGKDRLPALSGVASRLSEVLKTSYHAGLWRSTLAVELAWRRTTRHSGKTRSSMLRNCITSSTVVAPSWSWASIEYGSSFFITPIEEASRKSLHTREYVDLLHISTPPLGKDPFGQVDSRSSTLILQGPCRAATVRRDVPVGDRATPEDPEFNDWIYSTNQDGNELAIGQMTSDDPAPSQTTQSVLVLLLAVEWIGAEASPSSWAAMVLQRANEDRQSALGSVGTYHRIGLLTGRVRDPDLDGVGSKADVAAWDWMHSAENSTLIVV